MCGDSFPSTSTAVGWPSIDASMDGHPTAVLVDGKLSPHIDAQLATQHTRNGTWDTTRVPDGEHVLKFVARDARGNQSEFAFKVKIHNQNLPKPGAVWGSLR